MEARKALRTFSAILSRGKWLIAITFVVITAVTVWFALQQPAPTYSSQALLFLDWQQSSSAAEALNAGYVDGTVMGNRNVTNQLIILQHSRDIAEKTAERLIAMKKVPTTGQPFSFISEESGPVAVDDVALMLQNGLITVMPVEDEADAIWITGNSIDPQEAIVLANTYADEYVKRSKEVGRERIEGSVSFLEEQTSRRQADLKRIDEQIKQAQLSGGLALDAEAQRSISQIAQLEAQLDEARIDMSMKDATVRTLEKELQQLQPKLVMRMTSNITREIDQTQAKIAELEQVLNGIYARNPGLRNNPSGNRDIATINNQITQYREQVSRLAQRSADEIMESGGLDAKEAGSNYVAQLNRQIVDGRVELSGLKAKIASLEKRLDTYSGRLGSIPQQSMQLAQLERAHQSTEQVYNRLLERLEEAQLADESEIGFARIIRPATTAFGPIGDTKERIILLGLLFGLLAGFAAAIARYKLDNRLYNPDDLHEQQIEMLSAIPDMKPLIKKEFRGAKKVRWNERNVSSSLAPLLTTVSPASESYRRLYIALQFCRPDSVVQTVLLTSPEAGAGKTTTAINLAITAAQSGKRTIIIDADLRRPAMHEYLGIKPAAGLQELLGERIADVDFEQYAIGIENLYAILTPEQVSNPAQVLGSREMRELILRLKKTFDFIVIDSPPVLVSTDAAILSTQSDATVLVAAAGSTSVDALQQVRVELHEVGARVVGTVLNRFNPSLTYGYKDTYGYRYNKKYGYNAA